MSRQIQINTDAVITVLLEDGAGSPVENISHEGVTVVYRRGGGQPVEKTLSGDSFLEVSSENMPGFYDIKFEAGELDGVGEYVVTIKSDGGNPSAFETVVTRFEVIEEQKGQGAKAPNAGSGVAQIKKGEPYKVLAKLRTESGTLLQGQGSLLDVVVVRGDGSIVKKEMQESDWEPIPYTDPPAFWPAQAEGKHLLHLNERDTEQEGDLLISIKAEDVLVAHNMPLPPGKKTIHLQGVYVSETTGNVWAAGSTYASGFEEQEPYVVRKGGQGGVWEIVTGLPTEKALTFIFAEEDDNVFTGDHDSLYHWDGAEWSVLNKPVGNVKKMKEAADGTIWAVYANGLSLGGVLRIEGGVVIEASSGEPYHDLHVTEDLVWASGRGRRITKYTKDSDGQWNSEEKGNAPGLFTGSDIYQYYIITFGEDDPDYGFAVMPDQGAYETFDGGDTWSSFPISFLPIDARKGGAKAISRSELYLYDGNVGVLRYDGQDITKIKPAPGYVYPSDWTSHFIKEDLLAFANDYYVLLPGTVEEQDIRLQVVEDLGEKIQEVRKGLEEQRAILGEVGRVVGRQADFDIPLAAEINKGRPHQIKVRIETERGLVKGALAEDVGIRCIKPDGSVVSLDAQEGNWREVDSEEFPGLYTVQIPETVTEEEGEIILQISYLGAVVQWGEVQEVQQDDHLKTFGFIGEEGWVVGKRGVEGFWMPNQAVVYHTRDGGDTWEEEIFHTMLQRGFNSGTAAEIEIEGIGGMTASFEVFMAITDNDDGIADLYMYDTTNREWEGGIVSGVTNTNAIAVQKTEDDYLLWGVGTFNKVFSYSILKDASAAVVDKSPHDLGDITWLDLYAARQRGTKDFDVIIVGTEGAVVRYSYDDNASEYTHEEISAEIGAGSLNLNSVAFDPETETVGWIVGEGGFAVKTGDQGETWENVELNTSEDLIRVDILEGGEVWVFGKEGLARRSSDGGQTWENRDLQGEELGATIGLGREIAFVVTQEGAVKRLTLEDTEDTKTLRYNVVQAAQGGGGADLTEIESKLDAIITRLEGIEGEDFDQTAASLVEIKDAISNIDLNPVVTSLGEIRGTGFEASKHSLEKLHEALEGVEADVDLGPVIEALGEIKGENFDAEEHSLVEIKEAVDTGGGSVPDMVEIEERLEAIEEMVRRVLGLSQENITITGQEYDNNDNLTKSTITTYKDNTLSEALAAYEMVASYDRDNRLISYSIRKV